MSFLQEKETLITSHWRTWRLAWTRHQAAARNEAAEKKQILSQVLPIIQFFYFN